MKHMTRKEVTAKAIESVGRITQQSSTRIEFEAKEPTTVDVLLDSMHSSMAPGWRIQKNGNSGVRFVAVDTGRP